MDEIVNLIESVSEGFPTYSYFQGSGKMTLISASVLTGAYS